MIRQAAARGILAGTVALGTVALGAATRPAWSRGGILPDAARGAAILAAFAAGRWAQREIERPGHDQG
jgi:hypothetical protein